jgi:hypothetical protein
MSVYGVRREKVALSWAPQRERVKMSKKSRHERVPSHYGQRGEAAGFKFLLSALKPPLAKFR